MKDINGFLDSLGPELPERTPEQRERMKRRFLAAIDEIEREWERERRRAPDCPRAAALPLPFPFDLVDGGEEPPLHALALLGGPLGELRPQAVEKAIDVLHERSPSSLPVGGRVPSPTAVTAGGPRPGRPSGAPAITGSGPGRSEPAARRSVHPDGDRLGPVA